MPWATYFNHYLLPDAMRSLLFELADAAQEAVRTTDGAFEDVDVGMGADGTPTSRIDKVSEDAIFKVLAAKGNPLNVLSEEREFQDFGREDTLLLDPVDGTANAMSGIPFYSVSLAVGRKDLDGVRYGLVRNLANGETYYAAKGKGAFRDGAPIKVRPFKIDRAQFLVYLGNRAARHSLGMAAMPRRTRSMGSTALETCIVAAGGADLHAVVTKPDIRGLRVVDIAAASIILREAGGELYDETGQRFNMPFDIKARRNMLAVGDRKVLEAFR
jgi:fructose-1,6-bisphosphatase/inositol monophosphatase family enzyme